MSVPTWATNIYRTQESTNIWYPDGFESILGASHIPRSAAVPTGHCPPPGALFCLLPLSFADYAIQCGILQDSPHPCCGYEQLPPRIPPKLRQERGKKRTSCLGHRNSSLARWKGDGRAGKEGFRRALPARDVVVTPEHG